MSAAAGTVALEPSLERARELAGEFNVVPVRHTFVDDIETPVSAFLKLRGEGPSFLLESAEQGRLGRWSFLGFRPRSILRWSEGVLSEWEGGADPGGEPTTTSEVSDPYGAVADYLGRYSIAEPESLPPFAGGAVGIFGYDLVRTVETTLGEPNPDPLGLPDLALMISDVLVAFDHQRHEVTLIVNAFTEDEGGIDAAYARAEETIAWIKERLKEPVPRRRGCGTPTVAVDWESNMTREEFEANVGEDRRSTSTPATPSRSCPRSASPPTSRPRRSRSTAACARSTRRRTCTSSTSGTSRSPAPRRSRW